MATVFLDGGLPYQTHFKAFVGFKEQSLAVEVTGLILGRGIGNPKRD